MWWSKVNWTEMRLYLTYPVQNNNWKWAISPEYIFICMRPTVNVWISWLDEARCSIITNFVIFHPPQRKTQPVSLKISDRPVEQMTYVKYLGLIIDCHLNWKKHAHEVSKKIPRGIGILSKLRHFVTNDILTQLYYSLVYPFLTYGLIVWGNTYTTTLKEGTKRRNDLKWPKMT